MIERKSFLEPGYDCRKECKHPKPGQHGISGDRWIYVVVDGDRAVSLSVLSADYPPTVDWATMPASVRKPIPEVLGFHRAPEEGSEQVHPCDYLPGGKCIGDITYLGAREFWEAHANPEQREQSEAFWKALEGELP